MTGEHYELHNGFEKSGRTQTLIAGWCKCYWVDESGRILLQLRSDNNTWGYAGGSVEIDEKVEDAAKRELYEETGLIAKELTLLGVFSGKDMHNIYPNGDEVSNVDIVYICKSYEGELKCQIGEVENLKFFDITDLPDNIFKPNLPAIEEYVSKTTEE